MLKASNGAIPFRQAFNDVVKLLRNKIVVGHTLSHDFKSLHLDPDAVNSCVPHSKVRDVGKYHKYKSDLGQVTSLKKLSDRFLGKQIQQGEHSSVVDARAALALYRINEKDWENTLKQKSYTNARKRAENDIKEFKKMSSFGLKLNQNQ